MTQTVFPAPATPLIPVQGSAAMYPVRRIYCVVRNYAEHAKEMGFSEAEPPFFFMKPADAVLVAASADYTPLPYPTLSQDYQHEVELVVAIGKSGKNIAEQDAMQHVFGYATGLDMTRRDLQQTLRQKGHPWCISKGFDASAPIAPIVPVAAAGNISQASISLQVNGQTRQSSHINCMIWNIAATIAAASRGWELQAGDLIFTGTPAGVGAVVQGDELVGSISGLPEVRVRVV